MIPACAICADYKRRLQTAGADELRNKLTEGNLNHRLAALGISAISAVTQGASILSGGAEPSCDRLLFSVRGAFSE